MYPLAYQLTDRRRATGSLFAARPERAMSPHSALSVLLEPSNATVPLNNELVQHRPLQNQAEREMVIVDDINRFLCRQPVHQVLGYRSPEEFGWQKVMPHSCVYFSGLPQRDSSGAPIL